LFTPGIDIDGERYDVIGVMPAAGLPAADTELWYRCA
jgi:hypothetical protein